MKNKSLLSIVLVLCLAFGLMTGCGKDAKKTEDNQSGLQQDAVPPTEAPTPTSAPKEVVDYASKVELNMSSNSAKVEATVKTYVDGDNPFLCFLRLSGRRNIKGEIPCHQYSGVHR